MSTKRVLVTGASRGIGAATAIELARQGFDVTVHYHSNQAAADTVCAEISALGQTANTIQFDVGDRATTRQALEAEIDQNGAFYGVVCNAGIAKDGAFPALQDEQWDSVIHTNLDGFYNVLHPLIMPMIRLRQGGRIAVSYTHLRAHET